MVEEGDVRWGVEGGPAHVGSVTRSLCQPQLPDLNAARISSSRRANEPPHQCTTLAAANLQSNVLTPYPISASQSAGGPVFANEFFSVCSRVQVTG